MAPTFELRSCGKMTFLEHLDETAHPLDVVR